MGWRTDGDGGKKISGLGSKGYFEHLKITSPLGIEVSKRMIPERREVMLPISKEGRHCEGPACIRSYRAVLLM